MEFSAVAYIAAAIVLRAVFQFLREMVTRQTAALVKTNLRRRMYQHEDADGQGLISRGWWCCTNRAADWRISFGSSMVGEGGIAPLSDKLLKAVEEDRKRLEAWGVQDLDRALMNRWEHAGIDVDHAQMAYDAAELLTTPEEREEMRSVFILRLHDLSRAY